MLSSRNDVSTFIRCHICAADHALDYYGGGEVIKLYENKDGTGQYIFVNEFLSIVFAWLTFRDARMAELRAGCKTLHRQLGSNWKPPVNSTWDEWDLQWKELTGSEWNGG